MSEKPHTIEEAKYETQAHYEDYSPSQYEKSLSEEQIEHVPEGTASPGKALFMLLKAFIGTGVIFLPGSFAKGGLVLSIILMVIIASICLFSFQRLVKAQRQTGGSYGHVAETLLNRWVRYTIQFFLCLSQMGFVASYMIFISENVGLVIGTLSDCHAPFPSKYFIWIFMIIIIPLCWVRKIGRLGYCALLADIFILFGLICVLYFSSNQIHQHGAGPNITMVNSDSFALMIGTAVFSFEGIGMVVPMIEGMKDPSKFPRVLTIGMIICTLVFTLIGTIGYVAFGDTIQASIVANLPREPLSITVQLLYAIAMILTSPFMLYPALTIIEQSVFSPRHRGKVSLKWKWLKNLCRSMVALVCAAVSFGVGADGLDKFVALVGSIGAVPLCFIFPALFHFKITTSKVQRSLDIILGLFGVAIMIYTTYVNVNSWVNPLPSVGTTPVTPSQTCGL
ncbi:transmembrane amino acid transporter protein-domain-containing protein [Halteromyces radiatus]|uniref:transmembrane amino acid transporter protein-domain-containing protein n=1 Tax=Halteromyces radiatus TaxID=101107 RepID=UPI00221FFFD5|nr:transmembrane amino acid transporter protein-domain-containing protein [Halteromyces radiatus]KAI8089753.1 transmembrane amino acid transporter protein-domain-containing protein [Halteromyces radiatus]